MAPKFMFLNKLPAFHTVYLISKAFLVLFTTIHCCLNSIVLVADFRNIIS